MAKKTFISRYLLIIKKLRQHQFADFQDIINYLDKEEQFLQLRDEDISLSISQRTFQRDLKEIREIFGINIEYSKKEKGYFIENEEAENMNFLRVLESFEIFEALKGSDNLHQFVHLDKRRPYGTEHLNTILNAIQKKRHIQFVYQKFDTMRTEQKMIAPYAVKEFKNRWYLIGNDMDKIKTYALDRCSEFEVIGKLFSLPNTFNIEDIFINSFGIMASENRKPKQVLLAFTPLQAAYIRTLPLHPSQQWIEETGDQVIFSLQIAITYDFKIEILSMGNQVKVLKPESLAKDIKRILMESISQYD